ncbi:hypothetical protein Tco_1308621 [Tanacetum coccineum]
MPINHRLGATRPPTLPIYVTGSNKRVNYGQRRSAVVKLARNLLILPEVPKTHRAIPMAIFEDEEEFHTNSEDVFKAEAEVVDNGGEIEVQNQMIIFSSEDEEEFDTDNEVSNFPICPVTPIFQVSDANHLNENVEEEEGEDRISALPIIA